MKDLKYQSYTPEERLPENRSRCIIWIGNDTVAGSYSKEATWDEKKTTMGRIWVLRGYLLSADRSCKLDILATIRK